MRVAVHDIDNPRKTAPKWEDLQVARPVNPFTRVVLADDHDRVRQGLRRLLEQNQDILVVGEACDGIEALELAQSLEPDVLLLDIEMPRMTGPEVAAQLKQMGSPVRVLALSAHDDHQYIVGMLDNGVAGYLTKEEAPFVLLNAVRGVARGEQGWVSRRVAQRIASAIPRRTLDRSILTCRELDVLRMVATRKSDADIAVLLDMPIDTLKDHLDLLYAKFGVTSRVELSIKAAESGLVEGDLGLVSG